MSTSISRRLIFWLAVPLMLLALCEALLHYANDVAPGVLGVDRRLRQDADALMGRIRAEGTRVELDLRPEGGPPLPPPTVLRYTLRDAHGALLAGDARLPWDGLSDSGAQQFSMVRIDGQIRRALTTRFDTRAGAVTLTVVDLRESGERAARFGLMSTLLWDFVQLDLTLVLVWVGIQFGLRPIKRLRDEIAQRSPLDLRPLAATAVPREITPVVITLNRLFEMLRGSAQSQRQFIANTAHQLRTPITGIQAQLDLLAAEPAAQPVRARLATLQESIRQLSHSANQLLSLARADRTANLAARTQSVDLGAIVAEVAAKFFDRALSSQVDLGIEAGAATIQADPALLDDLLSNLVDNALKYTPAGGSVTAGAGRRNGRPFLVVEDTGIGIAPSERERVRQRFYRSPNSPGHGSGLGLAIVEEIASLYGGTVTISEGDQGRGTRVTVEFPA